MNKRRVRVKKIGCNGLETDYVAWFHIWGLKTKDTPNGCMNWTIAVVEKDDGVIVLVNPELLEFI